MSKKEAVLLIGRGEMFRHYIQGMINTFSKEYQVLVLEIDGGISYVGDYTEVFLPPAPSSKDSDFWPSIKKAEKNQDSIFLNPTPTTCIMDVWLRKAT